MRYITLESAALAALLACAGVAHAQDAASPPPLNTEIEAENLPAGSAVVASPAALDTPSAEPSAADAVSAPPEPLSPQELSAVALANGAQANPRVMFEAQGAIAAMLGKPSTDFAALAGGETPGALRLDRPAAGASLAGLFGPQNKEQSAFGVGAWAGPKTRTDEKDQYAPTADAINSSLGKPRFYGVKLRLNY